MFYFDFEDFHIVGASPEILVWLEGETVTVRPIANTRKRGATPSEDQALAAELLADKKERAEPHACRLPGGVADEAARRWLLGPGPGGADRRAHV